MSNSELIGSSTGFRAVLESVGLVAPVDSAALIQGEIGTGKEVIAQAIHEGVLGATIVSCLSIARLSDSRNSRNSLNSCDSREGAVNLSLSSFLFINLEVARVLLSRARDRTT
jgi:archaellum biogenesis ATPase FlaH